MLFCLCICLRVGRIASGDVISLHWMGGAAYLVAHSHSGGTPLHRMAGMLVISFRGKNQESGIV